MSARQRLLPYSRGTRTLQNEAKQDAERGGGANDALGHIENYFGDANKPLLEKLDDEDREECIERAADISSMLSGERTCFEKRQSRTRRGGGGGKCRTCTHREHCFRDANKPLLFFSFDQILTLSS